MSPFVRLPDGLVALPATSVLPKDYSIVAIPQGMVRRLVARARHDPLLRRLWRHIVDRCGGRLVRGHPERESLEREVVRLASRGRLRIARREDRPLPALPSAPEQPPQREEPRPPTKTSWIEIELVGEDDRPIPREQYRILRPDGSVLAEGALDERGIARVEEIDGGEYEVTFPSLDMDAWERA